MCCACWELESNVEVLSFQDCENVFFQVFLMNAPIEGIITHDEKPSVAMIRLIEVTLL